MMRTQPQTGRWPFDKGNAEVLDHKLERLESYVNEKIGAMAMALNIPHDEAFGILERVHVSKLSDFNAGDFDEQLVRRVGWEMLSLEIERFINAISEATALDTDEITEIFAKVPGSSVSDVSYRLHLRSLVDRSFTS